MVKTNRIAFDKSDVALLQEAEELGVDWRAKVRETLSLHKQAVEPRRSTRKFDGADSHASSWISQRDSNRTLTAIEVIQMIEFASADLNSSCTGTYPRTEIYFDHD